MDNPNNDANKLGRRGYAPVMTTHEDRQLGRKIMKPVKGPMILGKEGMPQYDNLRGSTARSKRE